MTANCGGCKFTPQVSENADKSADVSRGEAMKKTSILFPEIKKDFPDNEDAEKCLWR